MDNDKFNRLITGEVSIVLTEDEINSLSYAIGTLKTQIKEIKFDEAWKSELSKVVSDLEGINKKYMSAKYE